eukprot:TRINITY_DN5353_c0_g1_i1.p1 TRINITY_DN5353_c0_g1~~TRINITY_DN5353_c0_g1_i1.p1  ORF type:complete len:524 (-),score=53.85 TRINITY_DN5353_c0_g1_i1:174-1745(-)
MDTWSAPRCVAWRSCSPPRGDVFKQRRPDFHMATLSYLPARDSGFSSRRPTASSSHGGDLSRGMLAMGAATAAVASASACRQPQRTSVATKLPASLSGVTGSWNCQRPRGCQRRVLAGGRNAMDAIVKVTGPLNLKWKSTPFPWDVDNPTRNQAMLMNTLMRVLIPTILATIAGTLLYGPASLVIRSLVDIGDTGRGPALEMLGLDQSQFMQNFLTVNGLLFTILCGNTYTSLYNQQEVLYHALFLEVSEAKTLLEQSCLLCQGRHFYGQILSSISTYVARDLRRLDAEPAELLSGRPMDDPLECILYVTSVGVPSIIYDTVKDLRQARSQRLGAMQRKLPAVHFILLYVLGLLELFAFPFLGAGTASIYTEQTVLNIQSILFGSMCGAIVMTLQVCYELWQPFGGAYTVDSVMNRMVRGLEDELGVRTQLASYTLVRKPSLANVNDMLPTLPGQRMRFERSDEVLPDDTLAEDAWPLPQKPRFPALRQLWRRVRGWIRRLGRRKTLAVEATRVSAPRHSVVV